MTTQEILTLSAIATVAIFTLSFIADFASTVLQAWRAASPAPTPQLEPTPEPEPAPAPVPQPKFASIDWVQPEEILEVNEEINVIEMAKAQMPKTQPSMMTLPQTEESKRPEEWLEVVPSPVISTPRPDYTKLTVKQLRQEAKIRNIKNASAMAKKELIAALKTA